MTIRKAFPAEAEPVIRARVVQTDKGHEGQLNYGFNVSYKERLENGDYDR